MSLKNKRKLSEREKKIVSSNQDWKCGYCKKSLPPSYQVDHIVPFSISQDDDITNLMSLCPTCHAGKTQIEYNRIIQFKKLRANSASNLCWFCLEDDALEDHNCSKELKPIKNKIEPKLNTSLNSLDKFSYTRNMESITSNMSNLILNEKNTLRIRLQESYIYVNSFFTPASSFSIEEIAKAVFVATRTKRDSKRYDEVEITISLPIDQNRSDEMIDFLNENLPPLLPDRIFKNEEIEYTYLF